MFHRNDKGPKKVAYILVNDQLYCKEKDLVLCMVPTLKDIPSIVSSCHEDICGGHFVHDLTNKKIFQGGFVWPRLHAHVQYHCKSCNACQMDTVRRLTYEP